MEEILQTLINKSITKNDLELLDKFKPIILNFEFFKNILDKYPTTGDFICNNILNNLIFLEYFPKQIIFKKGDKINCLYIIFSGQVNIFDSNLVECLDEFNEKNLSNKKGIIKPNKRKNIFDTIYNTYDFKLFPSRRLHPGNSLGESFNCSISDKIIQANKKTIIGCVKYDKLKKIIKESKNAEDNLIFLYIKSLNLFGNMNNFMEKMKHYLKLKRYPKESYIFRQGDEFKTFYIIKKGNINISININKTIKSSLEQDLLMGNTNKKFINGRKQELNGYFVKNYIYNLVEMGKGDIIGDIEYYKEYSKYIYSAKCLSSVDLFEINLNKFKIFSDECGENLLKFHEKINKKIKFFENRIKEINSAIKRNNEDTLEKDKYTKIFLDNYTFKENNKNQKYINSLASPIGNNQIRYNSKKMLNSSIGYLRNNLNEKFIDKIKNDKDKLKFSNAKSFLLSKRNRISFFDNKNKMKHFFINMDNKIKFKSNKNLLRNKSFCFGEKNLLMKNLDEKNKINKLNNNSHKKIYKKIPIKEINKLKVINPNKLDNSLKKDITPGRKFINFIYNKSKNNGECEKNIMTPKSNKNLNTRGKYLINERNKKSIQSCEEINKSFFILNNLCIKSKSLKQAFFFSHKK